jgi:uncharacterized protein (TIGR02231 family)
METGLHRLLIGELPLVLEPDSVRVAGRGTAVIRILSVDVQQQHYVDTPSEKVRDLQEQIEALQDELRVLADKQAGLAEQAKYLNGLRAATTEFAKGLSRGRTTIEDQTRLLQFLQVQDEELRTAVRQSDIEKREIDKHLNKLQRELKQLLSARPRQRYQAQVEVEVESAGSFRPELSYVVRNAGWRPLYDVRLVEADEGYSLNVTYLAQITQNTGQEWQGVKLTVSTARPALNQRLPELRPWFLDVYRPPIPQQVRRSVASMAAPASAAKMTMADIEETAMVGAGAPEPVLMDAEVQVAEVQSGGTAVSFNIPGQTDIPSDGSPHKTTINQFRLDPKLDYLAVPKHTDAVFRRVTVSNTSPSPLLDGPVNLFVGDEFIGKNQIEYTPTNGEIELLLGVEEGITIERTLEKRDVDKRLLRDNRQLRYGYKIELKNLLATEAKVEVHDQIPVARHEQIKVKLERANPEPTEQSELHLLEWHLTLAAGAEKTVTFDFLVEHPRSLQVTGLQD